MTVSLDPEDLIAAARSILGGAPAVRDPGALIAAAAQPATSWDCVPLYPTLDDQAAGLLLSIVVNHPLADGNKRLGWVAARLFYALNQRRLALGIEDAVTLVLAVADGPLRDVPTWPVVSPRGLTSARRNAGPPPVWVTGPRDVLRRIRPGGRPGSRPARRGTPRW